MATYKVIQDIEAEDHLIGPLTLRQFIYGAVAALSGYFCFIGLTKHVYFLLVPFFPIMCLFGFFAFPWGRDQPTEVWALAKVRFLLLPRKRIWDQSGAKELVTVSVPKKLSINYTNGLSQTEVRSRLHALADTLDSHGWATKNVDPASAQQAAAAAVQSDRLVNFASQPREVSDSYVNNENDVLDENNRLGSNFSQMIDAAEASRRQQLISRMQSASQPQTQAVKPATPPDNFWFLNQDASKPVSDNVITPGSNPLEILPPDDTALSEELKTNKKSTKLNNLHVKVIQPPSEVPITPPPTSTTANNVQTAAQPSQPPTKTYDNEDASVKIEQARRAAEQAQFMGNNDLSVATIARQVNKKPEDEEVVINLH